jgi:hypothetical protein
MQVGIGFDLLSLCVGVIKAWGVKIGQCPER